VAEEILLPPNEAANVVKRLIEVLAQEFPNLREDHHQMANAGIALGLVAGSVAVWPLLHGGEESYGKFVKMVNAHLEEAAYNGREVAHESLKKQRRQRAEDEAIIRDHRRKS
jgi:hypothetical protein